MLGFEKGAALVESLPGIEAVFVFDDGSMRKTPGADFVITDGDFFGE